MNLDKPNLVVNQVGCSWHPVLSKFSKNPDLAAYWMLFQVEPSINHWNVAMGWTGVDPGTTYDWREPVGKATVQEYVDGGFDAEDAKAGVNAYQDNSTPPFVSYLRILGTPEMSENMDVHLSEAVTARSPHKH